MKRLAIGAAALVVVLVRYAGGTAVPLRAHPGRVLAAARGGIPLLVRTLALRAVPTVKASLQG